MKITFRTKPLINKNTKQISISIPKKKVKIFKKKVPKEIKFEIKEVKW